MDNMSARLNQTDAVLRSTNNVLIRAKELALQYGTEPTLSALDRANGVEQIRQLKKQIVQLANTKVGGQFIFAGSKTRTRPYQEKGTVVFYNGNNEEISIEIEEDRTVPVNIPGSRVFETSESGIFKMFDDFQRALAENNTESGREIIGRIDTVTEVVLNGQATNAARTQRVEISLDRLSDDEIDTLEALSIAEDVDIPRAITEFLNQQNTYQAALSSTARAIQPSLLTVLG
jgi:flagellar hook-associated protein 3 FlgL